MTLRRRLLFVIAGVLCWTGHARAQEPVRPEVHAHRTVRPPLIDGVIGENEWGPSIAADDWQSYNPLHGDRVPQRTTVWISYDASALYFAFKCDDPDPSAIHVRGSPAAPFPRAPAERDIRPHLDA